MFAEVLIAVNFCIFALFFILLQQFG